MLLFRNSLKMVKTQHLTKMICLIIFVVIACQVPFGRETPITVSLPSSPFPTSVLPLPTATFTPSASPFPTPTSTLVSFPSHTPTEIVIPTPTPTNTLSDAERFEQIVSQGTAHIILFPKVAEIMLTDSSGRRIGYDPIEGKVNDFFDGETDFSEYYDPSQDDNQIFMVPFLEWGKTITITITGVDEGEYTLFTFFHDRSGRANYLFEDTITAGEVQTLALNIYNNTVEWPAPPDVQVGPDRLASVGQPVTFEGSFVDKNPNDTHQIIWAFGDGYEASDTLTPSHSYSSSGVYTVTLTVVDSIGFAISDTLKVTVE